MHGFKDRFFTEYDKSKQLGGKKINRITLKYMNWIFKAF